MGKPKKTVKTPTDVKKALQTVFGKQIKYVGVAGARFSCGCGNSVKKGMLVEYNNRMFCSEACLHDQMRLDS